MSEKIMKILRTTFPKIFHPAAVQEYHNIDDIAERLKSGYIVSNRVFPDYYEIKMQKDGYVEDPHYLGISISVWKETYKKSRLDDGWYVKGEQK